MGVCLRVRVPCSSCLCSPYTRFIHTSLAALIMLQSPTCLAESTKHNPPVCCCCCCGGSRWILGWLQVTATLNVLLSSSGLQFSVAVTHCTLQHTVQYSDCVYMACNIDPILNAVVLWWRFGFYRTCWFIFAHMLPNRQTSYFSWIRIHKMWSVIKQL